MLTLLGGHTGVLGVRGRDNIPVETKLTRNDQVSRNVLRQVLEFYPVTSVAFSRVQSSIGTGHESIPVRRFGTSKSRYSEAGCRRKGAVPEGELSVLKLFAYPFDRSFHAHH